ncbi:MAG: hypothetical protein ACXAC7_08460 [Candidatus Hodarchaeales archaeon]
MNRTDLAYMVEREHSLRNKGKNIHKSSEQRPIKDESNKQIRIKHSFVEKLSKYIESANKVLFKSEKKKTV